MLVRLAMKLSMVSPWFRRLMWRRWYEYLAGYQLSDWRFMNYGYAPLDDNQQPLDLAPEDERERFPIQLYDRVARAVPLAGRQVLEVGCGRGGGSSFLKRRHQPAQLTGVDFSARAVRFCGKNHAIDGLSFLHGDAEQLPLDDASFDVVINVESSHCYGSIESFLSEVHRVLRPGGHFLFADLRAAEARQRLHQQMLDTGMTVLEQEDVTANVLEALRRDNDRKSALIENSVGKRLANMFRQFAAIEGSEVFTGFEDGSVIYLRYVLQKKA